MSNEELYADVEDLLVSPLNHESSDAASFYEEILDSGSDSVDSPVGDVHANLLKRYENGNGLVSLHKVEEEQDDPEETYHAGVLRVKKLDRHLKRLYKMEKETKRSRLRFEAYMCKEFEQLSRDYPDSANNSSLVKANTMKFMAIDFPDEEEKSFLKPNNDLILYSKSISDDEEGLMSDDLSSEEDDADPAMPPVFKTELTNCDFSDNAPFCHNDRSSVHEASASSRVGCSQDHTSSPSSSEYITARSSASDNGETPSISKTESSSSHTAAQSSFQPKEAFVKEEKAKPKKKHLSKNFISRNIQLAMDAASNVPMTDDEKKRLTELLADIEEETESTDDGRSVVVKHDDITTYRSSIASEGYTFDQNESKQLNEIDNKLQSICSSPFRSDMLSSRTSGTVNSWHGKNSNVKMLASPGPRTSRFSEISEIDNDLTFNNEQALALILNSPRDKNAPLGEKALAEIREAREVNTRLETIDEQLVEITGSHPYPLETELPRLDNREVKALVSQCMSSRSALSSKDDELSVVTYDEALATASTLPEQQLQDLLDQAKKELGLISLDAPQSNYQPAQGRASSLHDNETWSFLREVEANLEYPPAFLRMLPDAEILTPPKSDSNNSKQVEPTDDVYSQPSRADSRASVSSSNASTVNSGRRASSKTLSSRHGSTDSKKTNPTTKSNSSDKDMFGLRLDGVGCNSKR